MKQLMCFMIAIAMLISMFSVCAEEPAAPVQVTVPDSAVSGTPDSCKCEIRFDGTGGTVYGDSASVSDGVLRITKAGSYLLSGNFTGSLIIDVSKEKKVELSLNGLYMTGSVTVLSAPKNVTVSACAGSVNVIKDISAKTGTASAAIDSKADLKFKGEGALYVVSENNRGIHSSDDIEISSLELYVISAGTGIQGKDSVQINSGKIYVSSGSDGIKSTNTENEAKGYVEIADGEVTIVSAEDGIQAASRADIKGGNISIISGSGYTASTKVHESDMPGGMGSRGGRGEMSSSGTKTAESTSVSAKGIKAKTELNISGGNISINSADDALHGNKNTTVSGGTLVLYAGDDGVHAGSILTISGGNIDVKTSYEGIEGTVINISGGEIRVNASDDGINAGGDDDTVTEASAAGGFGGNGLGELNISGGYIVVNSDGDGMDTNNKGTMSGGTLIVFGPTSNYNGAIDYEHSFTFTGGTIIALGSSGMAQGITSSGEGASMGFRISVQADTLLTITDADGAQVLAVSSPKNYGCVVFASDTLVKNGSYDVYAGGTNSGICADYIYSLGNTTGAEKLGTVTAH